MRLHEESLIFSGLCLVTIHPYCYTTEHYVEHNAHLFWIIDNLHKRNMILGTHEWTPKKHLPDNIIYPTSKSPFLTKRAFVDFDYRNIINLDVPSRWAFD